jgi:hypothetical protein
VLRPLLVFAAALSWSISARADGLDYHENVSVEAWPRWLSLPAEFGGSAAWLDERTGPVYRFAVGVLPGVEIADRFGFHLSLGGIYRNPEFDASVGGRATVLVLDAAGGYLPVRVLAGTDYLLVSRALSPNAGALCGLGRLFHFALLGSYDSDRETWAVGLRFGIDLAGFQNPVGAITHYVPYEAVPTVARPEASDEFRAGPR